MGWKLAFNASLGQEIWPGSCAGGQLECGPLQKANTLEKKPLSLKMRLTQTRGCILAAQSSEWGF